MTQVFWTQNCSTGLFFVLIRPLMLGLTILNPILVTVMPSNLQRFIQRIYATNSVAEGYVFMYTSLLNRRASNKSAKHSTLAV